MKFLGILILVLIFFPVKAQNLVPNPSFEDTIACPENAGEIYKSSMWLSPTLGSPDLYCSCSSSPWADLPSNNYGFENARTGEAYTGIYTYTSIDADYREYLMIKLIEPLSSGKRYLVEFYVSLADSSIYSCSSVGCYFSHDSIAYPSLQENLPFNPQAKNDTAYILENKEGWLLITDTIIASGDEQFIAIGNFLNDSNSTSSFVGGGQNLVHSYYYIDDVSVMLLDTVDAITTNFNISNIQLSPNPVSSLLNIKLGYYAGWSIHIHDMTGELVSMSVVKDSNQCVIDVLNYSEGFYFIHISDGKNSFSDKFIVSHY